MTTTHQARAAKDRPIRYTGRMALQRTVKRPGDIVLTSQGFVTVKEEEL